MIIAACNDDPMVVSIAQQAATANAGVFGAWYKIFDSQIPDLGASEDLYIVAHGAAIGDENQPVIGNKEDAFYLTARDLNANLHIFPKNYAGRVYVYACKSAQKGKDEVSFIEQFKKIAGSSYPNMSIFGQVGSPSGPLPAFNDASWKKA